MNSQKNTDILLQNLDRVVIHANVNYFEKEHVQILGEVNVAGSYPLIKDNETLMSILSRAGGYTTKALKNGISIYRDKKYFETTNSKKTSLVNSVGTIPISEVSGGQVSDEAKVRVAWQNESISLMPGDSVIVKEVTELERESV